MLHEFIAFNRDEIIRRCRAKVATRSFPSPTDAELDHGVPLFLDQLTEVLRLGSASTPEIATSAGHHGHELLAKGFTVSQVVHDYGDVCQAVTELAMETHAPISTDDFHTLNQCLDDAIAAAVTQFGHEREQSASADLATARGHQWLGFFTHELRNLVNTASVSFEVLKTGHVGVTGSTARVLDRSLSGLRSLIARSLAEVRLTEGILNPTPVHLSAFIDDVAAAATLEGNTRGVGLTVMPVGAGVVIEADREVLALVFGNLLQNAFKFTRPHTTVILRWTPPPIASASRSRTHAAGSPMATMSTTCSDRSSSEAPIDQAWGSGSHSADGASKRITAASPRGTCPDGDASSPWISRASRYQPSWIG